MFIRLRKSNLWPILDRASLYSEDDIFDVIEFLYDFVSKPIDGWFHQYNGCGWHYEKFDQVAGQKEFCAEINRLVRDYKDGYELSQQGEILSVSEPGLDYLIQANIPHYDPANIEQRVNSAILKFRRYRSSQEDRRDAIRDTCMNCSIRSCSRLIRRFFKSVYRRGLVAERADEPGFTVHRVLDPQRVEPFRPLCA